jgi:chromosome segregation ATPase
MNSFMDGKPLEQPQPAKFTVASVRPKATPRYGLFGFLIVVALLAYIIYELQAAKKQIKESQAGLSSFKSQTADRFSKADESMQSMKSDFNVVRQRLGVTQKELDQARAYTQRMKAEHERSVEQLHAQISEKADTQQLSALKQEATTQFGKVNSDVTAVRTDVDATKKELEGTRRDLVDVKDTLTQQIARNRDEIQQLRLKGERNIYEFDLNKNKKVELVGDVRLMLLGTNPKKKKYNVRIVVDDNQLEKKDRSVNEPVQFLVGKTKLRYELVVNDVSKDRIVGYLSTPKDKGLSAEFVKN